MTVVRTREEKLPTIASDRWRTTVGMETKFESDDYYSQDAKGGSAGSDVQPTGGPSSVRFAEMIDESIMLNEIRHFSSPK